MAIPLGRNNLNIFRRHLIHCTRYPHGSKQPFTHKPVTAKDKKADSCDCPIWCLGYLKKETHVVKGKLKPKRVFASLGTNTWSAAESEIARLYDRGSLPSAAPGSVPIDNSAITVKRAGDRFLTSRKDGSLNPVEKDTYEHYRSMIHDRLLPYCTEKGIVYIRAFENQDVCNQFTESWKQMRRHVGELLAMSTRKIMFQRFKTFLKYCVENDWMTKSGAKRIKTKQGTTAEEEERYGLELEEYQQLLDAPDSPDLTEQGNEEGAQPPCRTW